MNSIVSTMQQAVAAIQRQDFATAQKLATQAARLHPKNPQILQVLGVAQAEGGDPKSGLRTMEKALSLAPDNADLRFNVAKAAFQTGQHAKVESICKPLGDQPAALHLRALALKEAGKVNAAVALFASALKQQPGDAQLLNNYGNALIAANRADDAITALASAKKNEPKSAQITMNLGRAHTSAERFEEALELFREAASLDPSDGEVLFELGKSLVRYSCHDEALPLLSEAARKGIRDPEVFNQIGTCYAALELRQEAENAYRMAIQLDQENLRAYLNLGLLMEQDNRLDTLERLIAEADKAGLSGPDVDHLRALVLQREGKLQEALELARESEPEFVDGVLHQEFIGKTADRLGQFDMAFEAFSKMNAAMALRPEAREFEGTEHSAIIRKRTETVSSEWFNSWGDLAGIEDRKDPIFLGGFLRSGTTLLDTILMGHSSLHVREEEAMIARLEDAAGDIANLAQMSHQEVGNLRQVYFAELERTAPMPHDQILVDKYPLMTVRAAYLHRAFPGAKYIFTLRHPCDVVLSCWMQNFRITRAMSSFLTLENAAKLYDATMAQWQQCRTVMPLDIHTIRYEDMVEDLESELRPLMKFLDLKWSDDLLDHQKTAKDRGYIRTPSYSQVTEKVYTRASGRWENYRKHLEPILPVLEPWIEKFGYESLEN
ncbi:sulfotransferase [Altererythrobacter sp. MF3-039]|uniref:sulfotransferase n=1 Tax=Altererythrobacter sp. MF3-039 TaxID=3252901 RepID=UPI00390C8C61